MFSRKVLCKQLMRVFQIRFTTHAHRQTSVLFKRPLAARDRRQPNRTEPIEKIHQHLLVIPTQADDSLRLLANHLDDVVHAARRISAASDQVAEKHQRICLRISRQHIEQVEELRATTMYVANDKSFHAVWSRAAGKLLSLATYMVRSEEHTSEL